MARDNVYDAIVVGTGITGGWAAKELTEKGLRTLVLERGRDVKHGDYPTATKERWELDGRTRLSTADLSKQVKERIAKNFDGRAMIIGRTANLTQPHNGRGSCMYRNRCIRGCPFGAYFS